MTTTSRGVTGPDPPARLDSPSAGSHNSWQTRLMIPRLLRPLWVLGETMGRCRPSSPHLSLSCIALNPPNPSITQSGPSPLQQTPLFQLLSDGWRGSILTLALWGLLCHSPLLPETPVCLPDSRLLVCLSKGFLVNRENENCPQMRSDLSPQKEAVSQTESLKYMFYKR